MYEIFRENVFGGGQLPLPMSCHWYFSLVIGHPKSLVMSFKMTPLNKIETNRMQLWRLTCAPLRYLAECGPREEGGWARADSAPRRNSRTSGRSEAGEAVIDVLKESDSGSNHLYLNRINSHCHSFESIQPMTQVVSPRIESTPLMT